MRMRTWTITRAALGIGLAVTLAACDGGEAPGVSATSMALDGAPFATIVATQAATKTTGSVACDGACWALWSNGYVEDTVTFPADGTYRFDVTARADSAYGQGANMELRVDGVAVAQVTVTATSLVTHTLEASVTAGAHRVAIAFTNDAYRPRRKIDRNLYVGTIAITGAAATTPTPSPTPSADAGSSPPPPAPSSGANLLFRTGFAPSVALVAPRDCGGGGCWQDLTGRDGTTGFSLPLSLWGSPPSGFGLQMLTAVAVTSSTIDAEVHNEIQPVTGPNGTSSYALFQQVKHPVGVTQDPLILSGMTMDSADVYMSEWLKFQPDLARQLVPGQMPNGDWGNWRAFWEWKTGGQGASYGGDYRVISQVHMDNAGNLSFITAGDNNANGGLPYQQFWAETNAAVPVPAGEWFHFEVFWHRSAGSDGRVWQAINGRTLIDHRGPNMGVYGLPINRLMLATNYSNGNPAYQWVTDIEMWDGFPSSASPH